MRTPRHLRTSDQFGKRAFIVRCRLIVTSAQRLVQHGQIIKLGPALPVNGSLFQIRADHKGQRQVRIVMYQFQYADQRAALAFADDETGTQLPYNRREERARAVAGRKSACIPPAPDWP